ncbi:TonB-dependent siderophore receptor [Celeribacter sp. ULVN23_4]
MARTPVASKDRPLRTCQMRRIVALLLASTTLGGAMSFVAPAAQAQQVATEAVTFNIPAQPLAAAINTFIRQTGWQISYSSAAVRGQTSTAVTGAMSPDAALWLMVAGTGLQVQVSAPGSAAISAVQGGDAGFADDGSFLLGTVVIQSLGSNTEGTGSYTTGAMSTGVKLPLSVKETPQTVTVVTHQKIKDKSYETLDQAVSDTPGLIANQNFGDTRYQYWSRGLVVDNIQYDGVANPVQYYARDSDGADDMDMYDRVEILRGASGLVTGAGNPSGAINLMRKRPLSEDSTTITTRASSWGNLRTTLDRSMSLNEAGTVRGRFIGAFGAGTTYRDEASNKDGLFYGIIEADVSDNTTVSLGYSYQKQNIDGYDWSGLPVRTDGSFYDFDASTLIAHDWQFLDKEQHTVFADVDHHFDNGWTFALAGRAAWSESDMAGSYGWYTGDDLYLHDRLFHYDNDVYSLDANLSGPIELWGREHDLVFGVNANRTELNLSNALGNSSLVSDPESWDPSSVGRYSDFTPYSDLYHSTKQIGVYAAGRFSVTDSLKVITGARLSWYDYTNTTTVLSTGAVTGGDIDENSVFTPYAGVVYDFNDTLSAYASYTSIFQPQYNFGRDGSLLDPIVGTNIEAGLKGEFFDHRLNGTLAVFQVDRDNVASRLSDVTYCNPAVSACFEEVDGVRTRGVELELSGFITDRWRLTGGYTNAVSEYTEGPSAGDKFATYQYPEQVFKLFTTYTLPGDKLTIGGGLKAQSKLYYSSGSFNVEQPGYSVVDLMARYDFNEMTSLQINVNNAFDKDYYSALNTSAGYGFFKGAPREVKLTLSHRF